MTTTPDYLYEDLAGNQVQVTLVATGRSEGMFSVQIVDPDDGHRIDSYCLTSKDALTQTARREGWTLR